SLWRFRDLVRTLTEAAVNGPLIVSSVLAPRQAMLAGLGSAPLPSWLAGLDLGVRRLIDLFHDHACIATLVETAVWTLCASCCYLPLKTLVFLDPL
ncbi:MAG: LysR family transcriptional regulator, partial [Pseudomonadota bacterium]